MEVCTTRHWQTSGQLMQELNVCTVLFMYSHFRVAFNAFYHDCLSDHVPRKCVMGTARCRDALLGMMGTILNTNCTCDPTTESGAKKTCVSARMMLKENACSSMYTQGRANRGLAFGFSNKATCIRLGLNTYNNNRKQDFDVLYESVSFLYRFKLRSKRKQCEYIFIAF